MKCFTYNSKEIKEGIETDNGVYKTCSINVIIPPTWDVDYFISKLKGCDTADILLYCNAELAEGDSESSIFPKGTIVVAFNTKCVDFVNVNNSALEIKAEPNSIIVALYADSIIKDKSKNCYIINKDGKAHITKTLKNQPKQTEKDDDNFVISL